MRGSKLKQEILKTAKITDYKWLNLFKVAYKNSKGKLCNWIFASRKENPFEDKNLDAVVIVAIVDTPEGKKIVITKEYRAPINDYEYGFPAGLIDPGMTVDETVEKELKEETGLDLVKINGHSNKVVSSAGLSDETVVMVFVEAKGELSTKYQEDTEDIEVFLYDINDVLELLIDNNRKVGAKGWGILYHYGKMGRIE
jgi:ADP-ribose pyrophosphatase